MLPLPVPTHITDWQHVLLRRACITAASYAVFQDVKKVYSLQVTGKVATWRTVWRRKDELVKKPESHILYDIIISFNCLFSFLIKRTKCLPINGINRCPLQSSNKLPWCNVFSNTDTLSRNNAAFSPLL